MDDTDAPPRRNKADDAETASAELKMRLALERLGTRTGPAEGGPGTRASGTASNARTGPFQRRRFVRDGEVPIERVPAPARPTGDAKLELAEERAARQRAEQALADAQGSISRLQMALSRAEQTARAARDAIEEREVAMTGLRAELAGARQREAALAAAAQAEAERKQAEAKQRRTPPVTRPPEPARWWLQPTKPEP